MTIGRKHKLFVYLCETRTRVSETSQFTELSGEYLYYFGSNPKSVEVNGKILILLLNLGSSLLMALFLEHQEVNRTIEILKPLIFSKS